MSVFDSSIIVNLVESLTLFSFVSTVVSLALILTFILPLSGFSFFGGITEEQLDRDSCDVLTGDVLALSGNVVSMIFFLTNRNSSGNGQSLVVGFCAQVSSGFSSLIFFIISSLSFIAASLFSLRSASSS